MTKAQANGIGWLWWDWYNPYGSENNLSEDGSADNLTATGEDVIRSHAASIARTARLSCSVPPRTALSINSGGDAVQGFVADTNVSGGNLAPRRNVAIDRSAVPAPQPPEAVYQTERWGAMTYRVGGLAASSSHQVQLHFAEVYFSRAGQRQFNVSINGARVLTDFDIFATAGAKNKAVARSFTATANARGEIVIDLTVGAADQPKIDAIVIQ
jgi:hypothetical protein